MKKLDKLENEFLPQVTIDITEVIFGAIKFLQPQTKYLTIANTGQVRSSRFYLLIDWLISIRLFNYFSPRLYVVYHLLVIERDHGNMWFIFMCTYFMYTYIHVYIFCHHMISIYVWKSNFYIYCVCKSICDIILLYFLCWLLVGTRPIWVH